MAIVLAVVVAIALGSLWGSDPPREATRAEPAMPSRPERLNEIARDRGGLPPGPATVDRDLIVPGGPPPDGIPPIDDPRFVAPGTVRWLADREPVLSVVHRGEAKAYPIRILMWHEIVNDSIGAEPVTVTYCPLCNTGVAFRRPTIEGDLLDFGTSGRLLHSNLVMYDRQTGTFWSQATLEAIVGPLAGRRLEPLPAQIVSWQDWRATHPPRKGPSQDTGVDPPYRPNPYPGDD